MNILRLNSNVIEVFYYFLDDLSVSRPIQFYLKNLDIEIFLFFGLFVWMPFPLVYNNALTSPLLK